MRIEKNNFFLTCFYRKWASSDGRADWSKLNAVFLKQIEGIDIDTKSRCHV